MKQSITVKVSELCYYLFFAILFFAKAVGLYDGQAVFKICLVIAAAFAALKIALTKYTLKEFMIMIMLILLGMIIYLNSGEKSALVFLVMMIGFKHMSLEKIMKLGLFVFGAGFGCLLIRSMLGMGNEYVMADEKFGISILRRGMGYSHPNVLHVSYAVLAVMVLFAIRENRSRIKAYILLFIGNIVVFLYSASYTGFMLVIFFFLFNMYFTYRKNISKVERILIQAVFPVCVLFSLFAPLLVIPDTPLFLVLNKLLNSRLYASRLFLQENPVTLLGRRIFASHTYALDSSYVTLLIYGGLILFFLVCAGYMLAIYMGMKRGDVRETSMLLSFAIGGVIEPFLFNLSFKNLSLLVVAEYLFSLSKEEETIKLFSGFDREISLYAPLKEIGGKKGNEGKAAVLSAVIALLAGAAFYSTAKMPEAIYVGEKNCKIEGELTYVDIDEIEKEENAVIYGYTGSNERLYRFDGDTISYERVRDTVRLVFVVFLIGDACLLMVSRQRESKRKLL